MFVKINFFNDNVINFIYSISNFFSTSIENCIILHFISGYDSMYYIRRAIYDDIIKSFKSFIIDEMYIFNVNLKFDIDDYIKYMIETCKFIYKKQNCKYMKIFKYKSKLLIIINDLDFLFKLNKKKKILKKLKKKYNSHTINCITFCNENYHYIKRILISNKITNMKLINCLKPSIVLLKLNNIKHINLLKLTNFKEKYSTDNINFYYIQDIYNNIDKSLFNFTSNLNIEKYLQSKLFNQSEAVKEVLSIINNSFIQQKNVNKPLGSWLLCGPSGTGKTELAKILSYSLFGSSDKLIKIDMSEYTEKHSISKLLGSPSGYVGYGEETILSNKFKNDSSFVILFDEVEKAYNEFTTILLQILDEGILSLANEKVLNFNKSFILLTSNLGCSNQPNTNTIDNNHIMNEIYKFFKVEVLNRLTKIIIFNPIDKDNSYSILDKFIKDMSIKTNFYININNEIKENVIEFTSNKLHGARPLRRFIDHIFDILYYNVYIKSPNKNYTFTHKPNTNKKSDINIIVDPIILC